MVARAEGSFENEDYDKGTHQLKKKIQEIHFYCLQFPDWRSSSDRGANTWGINVSIKSIFLDTIGKKKPQNLSSRMKSLIAYLDNNRNRIKLSISNMPVKKSEIIQVLRV